MAFTFDPTWNTGRNNDLSYVTGQKATDKSQEFTAEQITAVLLTAAKASIPSGSKDAEALQKALETSSSTVTVTKGAHQAGNPHIQVSFKGELWHVNIKLNGSWTATEIPARQFARVGQAIDYDLALSIVRKARALFGDELLAHPDIHGMGIGYRKTKGTRSKELCIIVHVQQKMAVTKLATERLIPSMVSFAEAGNSFVSIVKVDVQEAGIPQKELDCDPPCTVNLLQRVRPIPGGYSIGNIASNSAGTLGGWVWDNMGKRIVLLSNDHVLVDGTERKIAQPGRLDGGTGYFAELVRSAMPQLDAAIAAPTNGPADIEESIACVGEAVFHIAAPVVGDKVEKVGRTTSKTCGIITMIDYQSASYPQYGPINIYVDGDGHDFSQPGDSGSLYVIKDRGTAKTIVGLHWGGDGDDGIGHHISSVFTSLGLSTLPSGVGQFAMETALSASSHSNSNIPSSLRFPHASESLGFHHGFGQELSRRLSDEQGEQTLFAYLQKETAVVARTLLNSDGWRAAIYALMPILNGHITTDEVLAHVMTDQDVKNIKRLLIVAKRLSPQSESLISQIEQWIECCTGKSFEDVLTSPLPVGKKPIRNIKK